MAFEKWTLSTVPRLSRTSWPTFSESSVSKRKSGHRQKLVQLSLVGATVCSSVLYLFTVISKQVMT
jgi:hypothetical protein